MGNSSVNVNGNQLKKSDIKISKKKSNDENEPSSFYRRKEKLPKSIKSSIIGNASGKKPKMNQSRFGKIINDAIV